MISSGFAKDLNTRLCHNWKLVLFIVLPILLSPIAWAIPHKGPDDDPNKKFRAAYVIALMGIFWIFEVLPLAVTALLPLVLFPLLDVDTASNISKDYMKESNMIFLGGIVLALAIEFCGLHIRLALKIIGIFGANPARLMLGTMIITALLAMWLSDSSCTTMLLPILTALTAAMFREEQCYEDESQYRPGTIQRKGGGEGLVKYPSVSSAQTVRRQSVVFANSAMQSRGVGGGTLKRRSRRSLNKQRVTATVSESRPDRAPPEKQTTSSDSPPPPTPPKPASPTTTRKVVTPTASRSGTSVASGKPGSPGTSRSRSNVPSPAASRARTAAKPTTSTGTSTPLGDITGSTAPHSDDHSMGVIVEDVKSNQRRPNTVEKETNTDDEILMQENIRKMLLFAVAYSTNIGGTASLVGTGPIKVFKELIKEYHLGKDDGTIGITFATWMAFNLPNVLVNIFLAWLFLIFKYLGWSRLMDSNARSRRERHQVRLYLDEEYKRLGPISHHEIGVLIVFLLVVVLWLLRDPQVFPGWGNIYEPFNTTNSGDSTAAMIGVLLLFIIPKDWSFLKPERYHVDPSSKYEALLNWKFVSTNAPWGYVLLIGSGFAIADAAEKSGLSAYIATEFISLGSISKPALLLIVMIVTSILTEGFSNTACANLILPVLFSVSCQLSLHPVYLTMAAAVSSSYAFMLPISSPPNAIIFATGELRVREMLENGLILNVICIPALFVAFITYGDAMFHFTTYVPGNDSHCNASNYSTSWLNHL